jgi:outer membrane murein-binding lipoprotein Lpp
LTKNPIDNKGGNMKAIKALCLVLSIMVFSGCSVSPFSPRNQQKINNSNGKIEEIKSNQNGLMAEVGKLKQDFDLINSQLKEVQSGLLNINSTLSRNENSGIQILQGDGSLILVFSMFIVGATLWYRVRAIKSEKNLSIIAKEVAKHNLVELNDDIIKSAIKAGQGKQVFQILSQAVID